LHMNLEFSKLKYPRSSHIESYETLRYSQMRAQTKCVKADVSERTDRVLHYLHRSDVRTLLRLMYESKKPITLVDIVHSLGDTSGAAIAMSLIIEGEKLGLIRRTHFSLGTNSRKIAFKLTIQGKKVFDKCLELCEIAKLKYET